MSTFICVRVTGHFHAVLPSVFITPYSPYSIFFVLRVLFLKNHSKMTVAPDHRAISNICLYPVSMDSEI